MLSSDIKIFRQTEDQRVTDNGQSFEAIIRVEFKVGEHGPFVEKFPKTEFNAAVRDARLEDFAREIRSS